MLLSLIIASLHLGLGRSRAPRSHHDQKWLLRPAPGTAGRRGLRGRGRAAAGGSRCFGGTRNPAAYRRCARARACGPGPKPVRRERNKGEAFWRGAPRAQVHLHAYTDRSTEPRRRQVLIGLLRLETLAVAQPSQPSRSRRGGVLLGSFSAPDGVEAGGSRRHARRRGAAGPGGPGGARGRGRAGRRATVEGGGRCDHCRSTQCSLFGPPKNP
jgi:hypothetical protein